MLLTYKTVKDECAMLTNSGKLKFGGIRNGTEMDYKKRWNKE